MERKVPDNVYSTVKQFLQKEEETVVKTLEKDTSADDIIDAMSEFPIQKKPDDAELRAGKKSRWKKLLIALQHIKADETIPIYKDKVPKSFRISIKSAVRKSNLGELVFADYGDHWKLWLRR